MKFLPIRTDTTQITNTEWKIQSSQGLLEELEHLKVAAKKDGRLLLYRGQRDCKWLLDSTFVRSFKTRLFGIEAYERLTRRITDSAEFHPAILNLFLLKFGVLLRPSDELETNASKHDLDAWYELMKRIQQYPEEDGFFLKGTNLIDWSLSAKVALYFMNEDRTGDGALFVCDATATGNTLQTVPLGSILDKMSAIGNSGQALGAPLLFQPGRQIKNQRPKNQEVAYFAQMDLRYDLQEIWKLVERDDERGEIVLKLVLPFETKDEINTYLGASEIDTSFIYPDRGTSAAKQ